MTNAASLRSRMNGNAHVRFCSRAGGVTLSLRQPFTRFLKGLGGYPRFKASHRYSGWTYPYKSGWKTLTDGDNEHLELSYLGRIQMRGMARTWGTPTTCTIFCRNGKWYSSITVQCQPTRETGDGAVGIDVGCKDAITLSTGEKIAKPDFIKEGQRKVKVTSKKLRRKRAPTGTRKPKLPDVGSARELQHLICNVN